MRTTLRTFTIGALLGLSLAAGGAAVAGYKIQQPVEVGDTWAYGAIGSARNSSDTSQYIHCYGWAFPPVAGGTSTQPQTTCTARSAAGLMLSCTTNSDEGEAQVNLAANSDGYVMFNIGWPHDSNCSAVHVANYSYYPPKQ